MEPRGERDGKRTPECSRRALSASIDEVPSHAVAGQTVEGSLGAIHNAFHGEATSHLPANQPTIQRHRDHFGSGGPCDPHLHVLKVGADGSLGDLRATVTIPDSKLLVTARSGHT